MRVPQKIVSYKCDRCSHTQPDNFKVCPICKFNHETGKHEYNSSYNVEVSEWVTPIIKRNDNGMI